MESLAYVFVLLDFKPRKELASVILGEVKGQITDVTHDSSTASLLRYCQLVRNDGIRRDRKASLD